jgi:hypothetical protein
MIDSIPSPVRHLNEAVRTGGPALARQWLDGGIGKCLLLIEQQTGGNKGRRPGVMAASPAPGSQSPLRMALDERRTREREDRVSRWVLREVNMTETPKRPAKRQPEGASKRAAKVGAKQTPKVPAAPRAKRSSKTAPQATKPFLRFYFAESLRAKTLRVLQDLENAEDGRVHSKALADLVVELTESGMDYYFLRPLKIAKAGFIVQQSANLGMGATTRVLGSVIRNIIGGMDEGQLLAICGYIRQLME